MFKKMVISMYVTVYDGFFRTIGMQRLGLSVDNLLHPDDLDAGYKAMAADETREAETSEWIDALGKDWGGTVSKR